MKLSVVLAVSGTFLALAGMAQASGVITPTITDTYVFEASAGQTNIFNGSSVTISNLGSSGQDGVSFSLVDTDLRSTPFTGNEVAAAITSYDTTDWTGSFGADFGPNQFTVTGNPDSIDETTIALGVVLDPLANGTWTYVPVAVPDAASTFPLLLGILALLAGTRYCNRPPVPALARVRR